MAGFNDPGLLHIYPLPSWHGESVILGNKKGLKLLRDTIDRTLSAKNNNLVYAKVELFASDGEGFDLFVTLDNTRWKDGNWPRYGVPYSELSDLFPGERKDPPLEKIVQEGVKK